MNYKWKRVQTAENLGYTPPKMHLYQQQSVLPLQVRAKPAILSTDTFSESTNNSQLSENFTLNNQPSYLPWSC